MKFKLRLVTKLKPVKKGLYEQMHPGTMVGYDGKPIDLKLLEETFRDLYTRKPQDRNIKIYTNQAGKDVFDRALIQARLDELNKVKENDRKRFSFKSQIFKQTYKFGQ